MVNDRGQPPILVVAPDPFFRRSLAFLLEAEEYWVQVSEELPPAEAIAGRYRGVVLDHRCLPSADAGEALWAIDVPIILLVSRSIGIAVRDCDKVVEKPLLGSALMDAVHEVVQGQADRDRLST